MDHTMPRTEQHDTERGQRTSSDEGGFVLPWFALTLLVLIAMAGFGVDVWNWWYTAQKTQRAADAGALAGVVFMPQNFNGAAPSATTIAKFTVNNNGYPDTATTVEIGQKPNQLKVTVSTTVNNSFTSLLGLNTTNIGRSATAEFNQPVQMGSPKSELANDPEHPPVDQHWLNIGAPGVDKHTGDRYADYQCLSSFQCTGSNKNNEYLDTNYVFTVEVPPSQVGADIDIQAYDPEYANGGTTCDNATSVTSNWDNMTAGNIQTLMNNNPALFPNVQQTLDRYAQGQSMWCTGDDNTNLGTPQATAWIVREPGGNQFQPLSNPVLCSHQFKGYNTDFLSLLDPSSGSYDPDFYASFHKHYTLCHVTSAKAGKYFIQVRSNLPQGALNLLKGETPPEDQTLAGQNRYSLRVVTHGTTNLANGITVYAETHLPIYSNVLANTNPPATPQFYLARMLPGGGASGRVLKLKFYDIGDVGCQPNTSCTPRTTITVTPPTDATPVGGTSCTWTANQGLAMPTDGNPVGCVVSNITSKDYTAGFNGTLIEASISIPGNYNCNTADPNGCWFKIQMSYSANVQANDTTTWDASIGGDPVRLIK